MVTQSSETVVIIGGAIVGSSIAYFLSELGFGGRVVVIERDPSYARSSTALSAASIRTLFGCSTNIHMSVFGAHFLRGIKDRFGADADVGFTERGYLILGSTKVTQSRQAGVDMQRAEGADVIALAPLDAKGRFGIDIRNGRVTGVRLSGDETIAADWCVNAAGAASAALVRDLGLILPVEPRKRTVFCFKAPLDRRNFPMLFDITGAWIRPEGEGFIGGIAPAADNDPDASGDFEPHYDLLEDPLWPALAHRVPALQQLRRERAWAGHYEVNTLDHNGIIGPHDEITNLLFATGFSGHGVMHAPATGRGVAEWILHGSYQTLDLSQLGYGRIRTSTPLHETIVY